MKKDEILKNYVLHKLGNNTVFIMNNLFNFSYTEANSIVKDEFKNKYRYFGGLQCSYNEESPEYIRLEKWLCEIAENILAF